MRRYVQGKAINATPASIGKYLADQSRAFGEAAAAADSGGGAGSSEGASEPSPGRALAAWARAEGRLVAEGAVGALPIISESTSEHVVYLRVEDGRVVKRTRELYYGQIPVLEDGQIISGSASPADYLRRMALQTVAFHSDVRLEGVMVPEESLFFDDPAEAPAIIISQPWVWSEGGVTFEGIRDFLTNEGFSEVPDSFFGWVRAADGVVILDASADNFVMTREGLVPIDLQMNVFSREELQEAGFIKEWFR